MDTNGHDVKRRKLVAIVETDVSKVIWNERKASLLRTWAGDMNLRALASASNYSKSSISDILAGRWKEVDLEKIKMLVNFLGHRYEEMGEVVELMVPLVSESSEEKGLD